MDTIRIFGIGDSRDITVTNTGGDTVIDYGHGTITIEDQTLSRDDIALVFT